MNCAQCNKPIGNRAISVGGRQMVCSYGCRTAFVDNAARSVNRSINAGEGVRIPKARKAGRPKVREGDVSKSIAADLKSAGIWNTRLQAGKIVAFNRDGSKRVITLCETGTPDRMFADGLVVFVEVKGSAGEVSAEQSKVIDLLKSNGALAFVVDDFRKWPKIRQALKTYEYKIGQIAEDIRKLQDKIETEIAEDPT